MGFTTYEFYTDEYFGDSIAESSFDKWNERASDKLKQLCGANLTEQALIDYDTEIQKATCAIADLLEKIDYSTKNATDPERGNIKSISSGGQSISFGANDTLVTKVLSDRVAQERLILDCAEEHLSGTGLLYMGV